METLIALESVSKFFGGVEALLEVDFEVHRGEVVALVGDNAAGKSTLAKILAGIYQPDGGRILMSGQPVAIPNAQAAFVLGIASVFQANALPENLDVVSNIFLGQELANGGLLDQALMESRAQEPFIMQGNTLTLQEGMTFSVEPGFYIPNHYGARIEDIVLVTATGYETLNNQPRTLQ